jgi:voltage-gated potassium channel
MRRRVYEILTGPRSNDLVGRVISFLLLVLIAANVTASVLETDAEIRALAPGFFRWFEIISVAVFTVEYVLRLWSCTADPEFAHPIRGRLKQAGRPMALVDLVAIAPSYLELALPGTLDFRFLRALRLMRLFRLLRIGSLGDSFAMLVRVVQGKRGALVVSLAVVVVAMVLAAGAMYVVEHKHASSQFTSIPRAMWWAIITITTVGYGDMTPATPLGQAIAGFVAFLGICALALPVGIISSGYLDEVNRRHEREIVDRLVHSCPHCGGDLGHAAAKAPSTKPASSA